MSASCSIAPDSRKSAIRGLLSSRLSTARFNCDRAITGTFEGAGHRLQPPADLGDLLLAAIARVFRIDELDVIDQDQADGLRRHPASALAVI